jgi:glycosyltransferase involved in cell wall biosynthesis
MKILILASIPFDGIRRRQQQVAIGLAARGHEILYLEPPRPIRSLIDPARFEPQVLELPAGLEPAGEDAPGEPSRVEVKTEGAGVVGLRVWSPKPRLRVARRGVAMARMGRWGWATRAGWRLWSMQVRRLLPSLTAEGDAPEKRFRPDLAIVYHPALIPAVHEGLDVPVVFDCVEDFPSLAGSSSIAAAFEDALARGLPRVDGFLTVNRYIAESWGRLLAPGVPSAIVEHGVDLTLFRPVGSEGRRMAREALEIPPERQVAGYLGRFDARISFADLQQALTVDGRRMLLLLGEVDSEGEAILQRLPSNQIRRVGPLRQEQASALLGAADILLLPFRREPQLEAIRGLKHYEYLATGLPTVAAFRRSLKAFRELLYLYTTQEEMEAAIREALRELPDDPLRAKRVAAAAEASWEKRLVEITAFLETVRAAGRRAGQDRGGAG